jgi:hypothetical protein
MIFQTAITSLVFLAASASPALGQNDTIGCFVPGECQGGTTTGISIVPTVNECLDFCDTVTDCAYFTFEIAGQVCVVYSDGPELSAETCFDCVSGDALCPDLICEEPGK